ncbi:GDP-mannose 4,6-dehydratase [Anaerolineales bacterium HSG25]|nr:GDP-mannose 4,6-dehydratase [Anaerolineales bacterium HSG25]
MRVLLTGITGFAGGHLAQELIEQGATVFGIDRSSKKQKHLSDEIELITADLRDLEMVQCLVKRVQPDIIYHLAAQAFVPKAWQDPWATLENNIRPQLNILQSMAQQQSNARILLVASDQVYGPVHPDYLPVDEQTPLQPNNPYGVSKVTQDMLGLQYYLSHNLNVLRVRPFNHIGSRQSPFFVASNFAKQIAEIELGLSPAVMYVGNLEAKRDFTNVKDVVRAYTLVAQHGQPGEVYNIGTGQAYSIQYLLDVLLGFSQRQIEIKQDPARMRPSDVAIIYADNNKLKETTGWQPVYSFEESLRQVLDDWRGRVGMQTS